jgi:O-antigen/teichoic acid export membrane protein
LLGASSGKDLRDKGVAIFKSYMPMITILKARARRLQKLAGLDRAIFFTLMARGWTILAGVTSMFLIARFLSPTEQGYYYTFSSLVAIQVIFELGFSFVILQMAAHERAQLNELGNEKVEGDPKAHARLASILQKTVRWYTRAAILMAIALLTVGIRFFSSHSQANSQVHWLLPWCMDAVAASITFQIDPIISFLEGCGWVANVAKMRFAQAVLGGFLAWGALLVHHGLFAPAMVIAGQALVGLYFVVKVHGRLLLGLFRYPVGGDGVSWRREIWPFQWRIAISWASAYFIFQLFNPVLFAYRGPREAGRMGMSLSVASSLSAVGLAWIGTKAAPFGALVARKQFDKLDALFRRTLIQSTVLLALVEIAVLAGLEVATHFFPKLAGRLLPIPSFSVLLLTILLGHIVVCEAYYLRAHKQEPFLWFWIWIALASSLGIVWAAPRWGAAGVTVVYFICGGFFRLLVGTYLFFTKRKQWHHEWHIEQRMKTEQSA